MTRTNFLPWREKQQRQQFIRFLKYAILIFLLIQMLCGAYGYYLYERCQSLSYMAVHNKHVHQLRDQQKTVENNFLKQLGLFNSLYQNLLFREKQRAIIIALLPAFKQGVLKKLVFTDNHLSIDVQASSCRTIGELEKSIRSLRVTQNVLLSNMEGGKLSCRATLSAEI
ncbi:MAG: hypothetical protein CMF39_02205 [Legionellaceae bacterium]|nr:hypothetical protein [Legionellaceae bacterium]